jgi:hypothetical protein
LLGAVTRNEQNNKEIKNLQKAYMLTLCGLGLLVG